MTDQELVEKILKDEPAAFRSLVEAYQDRVFRTAFGLLNNREDAEDIAQEVFVEVYRSLSRFRGESRISTWLYRITVNKSINLLKRSKRQQWPGEWFPLNLGKMNAGAEIRAVEYSTPHSRMEHQELGKILDEAIRSLPEKQRIAFTLHKVEDLPHKEIAEIMNTTASSVESLIFRAKRNLQLRLIPYYEKGKSQEKKNQIV